MKEVLDRASRRKLRKELANESSYEEFTKKIEEYKSQENKGSYVVNRILVENIMLDQDPKGLAVKALNASLKEEGVGTTAGEVNARINSYTPMGEVVPKITAKGAEGLVKALDGLEGANVCLKNQELVEGEDARKILDILSTAPASTQYNLRHGVLEEALRKDPEKYEDGIGHITAGGIKQRLEELGRETTSQSQNVGTFQGRLLEERRLNEVYPTSREI